jgi:adenylate kinase family enzyme
MQPGGTSANMLRRINIFGAAGTGTSTIGRALATSLGIPHVEADDCFWLPTDPPFQQMRPPAERQAMLDATLDPQAPWVLSGSIAGWGDPIVPMLDLAVFLWVPPAIRLARLLARERERHGDAALAPGGAMHDGFRLFMSWAAAYDRAGLELRSRKVHGLWMRALPCPLLRLEGTPSIEEALAQIAQYR